MNLQESVRRILREEFLQYDFNNQIIKNVKLIDSIINALYPNFNREGTKITRRKPLFWETYLYTYKDKDSDIVYATYADERRGLHLDKEVFDTLENYLGVEVMTNVVEWFNEEFNKDAEYVTFKS